MPTLIPSNGGSVACATFGASGPAIVAVPGIGDTAASYAALAPRLVAAGYTLHVMDLRGHGASDAGFPSYTPEDVGDDLVAVLDALDLRDVTLMGSSIGGAAIAHAALRSDRVGRLVLLSAFVDDPPGFGVLRRVLPWVFAQPWGVAAWGAYRRTLFVSPPADMARREAEVLANLREPGRLRAVRELMCASKASIAARLAEVGVPALIAMGAQDPDFRDPAAEAQAQAARLGGASRVVMIDAAGHYPHAEQPEVTARATLDFLHQDVTRGP